MRPKVSVVIPTLGRERALARCLDALAGQTLGRGSFEVIVVGGDAGDGSRRVVSEAGAGTAYMLEGKKGAGAARNRAIRRSRAPLIAFTDDDCVPSPGWLEEMLAAMDDLGCSGAGGDVLPLRDSLVGRYMDFCGAGRPVVFGTRALHLPTTNAIYRRKALLDVGMFDERIVICEDMHLSQKMLRKGHVLRKIAGAVVRHEDPADLATLYRKSWLHGTGLAAIAEIEGMRKKRGWMDLGRDMLSRSYNDRFSDRKALALSDRAAFAILSRIQRAGIHFGYISRR
jgi:glycosyltransferase involved in cell wall biosynthesis